MTSDDAFAARLKQLNVRAYNALRRNHLSSAEAMHGVLSATDLLDMRNMGVKSLAHIVVALIETQEGRTPVWLDDWCDRLENSPWWAPAFAEARQDAARLADQPRLASLQLAVIEAAKAWRSEYGHDGTTDKLIYAVDLLILFEDES